MFFPYCFSQANEAGKIEKEADNNSQNTYLLGYSICSDLV